MRKLFSILVLIVIIIFSVPLWRAKIMYSLFGSKPIKGVSIDSSTYIHKNPIASFSSENIKVNIYSTSSFMPKMDAFKLKNENQHYLLVETSLENISDTLIDPSWFSTTYFIKDNKGNFSHGYLDKLSGYYQEKHITMNDSIINSYYKNSLAPKNALKRKYFFFPMDKDATPVSIYFDDPVTKKSFEFAFP